MTIIDTNSLPDGAELQADVCIVGAGAAGITIARQFEATNTRVCLLESGDFKPDERVQALYELDNVGYPMRENFMSRARYFGGSCNLWAGRAMRLSPLDFAKRPWVPGSGWPLSYNDLTGPYEAAEQILGLPPAARFAPLQEAPGLDARERALLHGGDLEPVLIQWGIKPMRFGRVYRSMLRRSRNLTVYLNANVTELMPASSGRVIDHLVVRTLAGKTLTAKARTFVLAGGGLENARLLLVSRSRHPEGVGNDHDLVGRYYLDHPRVLFGRIRLTHPISLPYLIGLPLADGRVQLGIRLSEACQRQAGLLNSYVSLEPELSQFAATQYGRSVNVAKVVLRRGHAGSRLGFRKVGVAEMRDLIYLLTPREIMPHFLYRPYAMLKRLVRKTISASHLTVINFCEQAPDPDSRVTLTRKRDALNMPTLALDWRVGDQERRSLQHLHRALARGVQNAGIGRMEDYAADADWGTFTDASHHMGTTRMSDDPKTGVVDRNCQVHGVANLYVSGSAVFPTVGHANPTLTIVALALRLSEHLKRNVA